MIAPLMEPEPVTLTQRPALAREVPAYSQTQLHPKTSKFCVIIPVINEGERIRAQLKRMQELGVTAQIDVVIADGGSTDGSLETDALRALGVAALLVKTGPGRLSAQLRMGFSYALDADYQGIVTIDGNNKDDPSAIPSFVAALEEGYEHLQGSRFIRGGVAKNTPFLRWLGIRLVHAPAVSFAAGVRYTDTTNGFRAYSRRLLDDPRVAPFREVFSDYELHYYLAIRAPALGYAVKELPVRREYPSGGPVPTKIKSVRGNLLVLRTLVLACLNRFNPR